VKCPCHSGKEYTDCCGPYHNHEESCPNARALMRSRYSGFALEKAEYIMETTHPENPAVQADKKKWGEQILAFSKATEFKGLEILDFQEKEDWATVTFKAILLQGTEDQSFTEKSTFYKVDGKWLYHSGQFL